MKRPVTAWFAVIFVLGAMPARILHKKLVF